MIIIEAVKESSTKHHFDFSEAIDLICREGRLDNREFDVADISVNNGKNVIIFIT